MFRSMSVFALLWVSVTILAQEPSNPFALKYRPNVNTNPVKKVEPIARDTVSVFRQPEVTVKPDTSRQQAFPVDSPNANNPFGIDRTVNADHIPLPDTTVAEEKAVPDESIGARKPSKGIQIFFLLLSLLFLIFIVNVERSFVRDLWKVISNENYSSLHLRNQRNSMRQILLLMGYLVFVMQAGIFLYHTLALFNYRGRVLDNIWTCISLVFLIYLVRHAVIRYLRWLFNNEKEMALFSFDISIFNIMVGLTLLPINVLVNFGPESAYKPLIIIGLIIIIAAYIMRQLRWLLTARQLIAHSLFLFFIYLCAIEILPLWAISRLFW